MYAITCLENASNFVSTLDFVSMKQFQIFTTEVEIFHANTSLTGIRSIGPQLTDYYELSTSQMEMYIFPFTKIFSFHYHRQDSTGLDYK